MFASANVRSGGLVLLACAAMWFGGVHACATAPSPELGSSTAATVTDVAVAQQGETRVVTLSGPSHPVFTAFRGDDPKRLVVDLTGVRPADGSDSLAIYDGLVEEVSIAEFATGSGGEATRVEISLADDVEFDVVPQVDRVDIRLWPAQASADASDAAGESVAPAMGEEIGSGPSESASAPSPATALRGVTAESFEPGTLVRLETDGAVGEVESFALDSPARLVIDLPGLASTIAIPNVAVGTPEVSRIRIGAHPDKVRVVIDAGETTESFASHRVAPGAGGVIVSVGEGERLAQAFDAAAQGSVFAAATPADESPVAAEAAQDAGDGASDAMEAASAEGPSAAPASLEETSGDAAPAAADASGATAVWEATETVTPTPEASAPAAEVAALQEEAAPEAEATPADAESADAEPSASEAPAGPAHVYGVQFEPEATRDRVVIVADRPVEPQLLEPEAGTLVVSLPGAEIDDAAQVRIAPEEGGPVSLVTAFSQPDVSTPEVRVVVQRAPGLEPTVTRQGPVVVLDFPRTGAAAEPPPVVASRAVRAAVEEAAPSRPTEAEVAAATEAAAPAAIAPAAIEPSEPTQILEEGGLLDGKQYVGRRISLDLKDVDIQDVLRLIADVSDLNIIAGDEVSGKVTIRLVDVPWDQALDVILLTKGLGFVRVGNVLRIAPSGVLKAEEEARLQERRSKERLEDLVVKLQPVNYADVGEVSAMVKRLLTARGTVDVDERTNTVILKDIPSVIDEATALIKAIDTQTPQVMIEAKVVEASLDFSRDIGSEWGLGSQPQSLTDSRDFTIGGVAPDTVADSGFPFEAANNAVFQNPISAAATGIMNLGAFLLDDRFNVSLRLAAAEANGEGKVISSPRVVTLDNREALIEQGVSIPFQTFENGDAQLEFIDAVLSLKVTPHITADRSIIMKIAVTRNAPDDSVQTPTGSPAIAKNQAKTETLVKDGQTLVIGGIYVVDKSETQSRTPFLHNLPGVGMLFKNQALRDIRKELLIFVTPRVVVGPELAS